MMRSRPLDAAVVLPNPSVNDLRAVYLASVLDAGRLLENNSPFPDFRGSADSNMIENLLHGCFSANLSDFSCGFIKPFSDDDSSEAQLSAPDSIGRIFRNVLDIRFKRFFIIRVHGSVIQRPAHVVMPEQVSEIMPFPVTKDTIPHKRQDRVLVAYIDVLTASFQAGTSFLGDSGVSHVCATNPVVSSQFSPQRGLCSVFHQFNPRLPGEDVPPRIRQAVVAVQIRQATDADPGAQVAERKPETPHDSLHSPVIYLHCNIGALPLCAAYAAHSPRFPFGESRARMFHHAADRPLPPSRYDKPPKPTPEHKRPNASHSRVPALAAFI